jgi:zinc protease
LEPILELEADRFQNLKYSEEIFRTETRAVLSEYNKNFSSPLRKLDEVLRNEAFQKHTYKHTTMGFVEDVENMPTMYDYGLQFFDRYYRPEYTVVSVIGDVTPEQVRPMVEKYWGQWKRGDYKPEIPAEPPQPEAKRVTTSFHAPTLPWVSVSFHAPAYSDETVDSAVLDVILFHAFSENSELYKKLVLDEQKVDVLFPDYSDHVDAYLFSAVARVKDAADLEYVEQQILAAFEKLKQQPIPAEELESVKSHLRYQFALGMNSTAAIADTLAHYLSLRRTPETVNKRYALYQQVTPDAITAVAKRYFVDSGRTVATLQYEAESPAEKSE